MAKTYSDIETHRNIKNRYEKQFQTDLLRSVRFFVS